MIELLRAAIEALPEAQAAWIGGGAAFGRVDRFSDIDVQVVCEPEHGDAVFAAVEAAIAPIELTWRVPEPAWHGLRQRFYRLAGRDPHGFVDLCVLSASQLGPYLDPVRHGQPVVLFDRAGVLVSAPSVPDMDGRLRLAVVRFRFFGRVMVERAVGRGKLVEAAGAWHGLVLTPLVEVLRARWSPERQDFGLRYTDLDLPRDVYGRLEELAVAAALPDYVEKLRRAEALFDETVDALVAAGRLPGDGRTGTW